MHNCKKFQIIQNQGNYDKTMLIDDAKTLYVSEYLINIGVISFDNFINIILDSYENIENYNRLLEIQIELQNQQLWQKEQEAIALDMEAGNYELAALRIEQAELKYISVRNKAIRDISASYERFLTAADNLNHYESKIITGSENLMDTSIKNYEAGKSDITSLIVMKQSYKSIIIGYTQALAEYYNSWTNFLREVNDENFIVSDI